MKPIYGISTLIVLLLLLSVQCNGQQKHRLQNMDSKKVIQQTEDKGDTERFKTLHDFTVKDIDGKQFDLASLKGKKVLVVNVASKCGFTPQYEDLQALYERYGNQNFVVIGFPANNFNNQEPGNNQAIKEFCTTNYGVTFPMMEKVSVKGKDQAPLYKWLTQKSENGVLDQEVTWNFQKFLLNEQGELVNVVMPKESPLSDKIVRWITEE
ncbi:MAG TPA: glutathione peroxidase [Porphyromonadaceae bacterium]|nr:glutathione peroxidase [Porphyromonadaceae bacterium]